MSVIVVYIIEKLDYAESKKGKKKKQPKPMISLSRESHC